MQVVKKIGIIFVVAMLITATGGYSIYHHICHCAGEISTSLFVEADCAHVDQPAPCCHSEKLVSCCHQKEDPVKKHQCQDDHCCQDSSQFLKINDSFQPGFEKISLKPVMMVFAEFFVEFSEEITSTPHVFIYSSDLPPPDSGKEIITALHQLKLDTHLV